LLRGRLLSAVPRSTSSVGIGQILALGENGYTLVRPQGVLTMPGLLVRCATVVLMSISFISVGIGGEGKSHHVAIQIDQNDPQVMNLVLNNATNVIEYYRAKKEEVDIDIVAYGPGLHMLRADTSPVQDRIKRIRDIVFPGKIQFSACNNTKEGMEKTEGRAISILPEATMVASGVVQLMELQEQGWSYVRP
jgi:uncharacterized protein